MKNFRRIFCIFLSVFAIGFTLGAQTPLTEQEIALINKVLDLRVRTRLCQNQYDAVKYVDELTEQLKSEPLLSDKTKEISVIVDNFLAQERYIYMYETTMSMDELKEFIVPQYDRTESWRATLKKQELSPWLYLSSGDVVNSALQFLPQTYAIKYGLKEKAEYDSVVEKYPELSFGLINSGLWYYFAPAIGGGNNATARAYMERAVKCAVNDYERFYSRIFYSQMLYESGSKEECKKLLDECDEILRGNVYTESVRFLNENGFSLLFYTNNRDKVEKKIGKLKNSR